MRSETRRLALALALSLALPFAAGCSQKQPTSTPEPKASEAPAAEEEPDKDRKKDPEAELQELQNEGATESTTDSTATPATGNKIGAAGIGFVTVPDSWKEFHDVDGNSSIQWCDGTPYTIISLNTFDMSSVPEDQRADFGLAGGLGLEWKLAEHWAMHVEARCYYSFISTVKQYMDIKDYRYNTTIGLQAGFSYIF